MSNEVLLLLSVVFVFGAELIFYRIFGSAGLYAWMALATVCANIEVSVVVDAFGIEQTLGNVLFASTFLATDILSETEGKKSASRAVAVSIAVSASFLILSQSWLLYTPSGSDTVYSGVATLFKNTPRILFVSLAVFAAVQAFDVFTYHYIWQKTTKRFGDSRRFLWLRNNAATMLSQLLNTAFFTFFAFWGIYPTETLLQLALSTLAVYLVTSLLDTPAVYLARRINDKRGK